jgi:hypothetical protein
MQEPLPRSAAKPHTSARLQLLSGTRNSGRGLDRPVQPCSIDGIIRVHSDVKHVSILIRDRDGEWPATAERPLNQTA